LSNEHGIVKNKPFQDQCGQEGWKGGYIPFWCHCRHEVEGWGASIFWGSTKVLSQENINMLT